MIPRFIHLRALLVVPVSELLDPYVDFLQVHCAL
jgi:hypothetical protein